MRIEFGRNASCKVLTVLLQEYKSSGCSVMMQYNNYISLKTDIFVKMHNTEDKFIMQNQYL